MFETITKAVARRILYGPRKPRTRQRDHRAHVRAVADQLRAELAADKLQQVRAALAYEQAFEAVAEAVKS